jgi:hypothetical protein
MKTLMQQRVEQLASFQTLLETKTALDMEIAVYRKLVESEEDRLGIDNTDNSESQGGYKQMSSILADQ